MATGAEHLAAPPETLDEDPSITALMTTHLIGITADAPLSTALRLMATTGVRHLPVLEDDRCRGVVLEVDIARFVASGSGPPGARAAVHVEELTRPVEPLPVTARRSDAARRMQTEHADAVLVIDKGRLVGIVTATDIVRSLASVTCQADDRLGARP